MSRPGYSMRLAWTSILATAVVACGATCLGAPAANATGPSPAHPGGGVVLTRQRTPTTPTTGRSAYVAGGTQAPSGSWPYLDDINTLETAGVFRCTGERIAADWVLTAQHCLVDAASNSLVSPGSVGVALGVGPDATRTDWQRPTQVVGFPGYDPATHFGDIALLRLSPSAPDTQVVNLARTPDEPSSRPARVYVAGWGAGSDGGPALNLPRSAPTYLWSQTFCSSQWGTGFDPTFELCAGGRHAGGTVHPSTCAGDSGGPLVAKPSSDIFNDELLGTTDFISAAGCQAIPPVFQRISYYYPWLISQTGLRPVPTQHVGVSSRGFNSVTLTAWIPPNEANGIVQLLDPHKRVVARRKITASSRTRPVRLPLSGLKEATQYSGYAVRTVSHYGNVTVGKIGFSTVAKADLSVSIRCQAPVERVGHAYACRLTVRNAGPNTATNVNFILAARPNRPSVACTARGVPSGWHGWCSVAIRPFRIGRFQYTLTATSSAFDPNHRNNSASVAVRVVR